MTTSYPIGEAFSAGLCRAISSASWEPIHHPWTNGNAVRAHTFGQPLVLLCGAETTALNFLRHAWSGAVRVTVGSDIQTVQLDLDEGADTVAVELTPQDRPFQVTIEALPVEGRDSNRCEVWLMELTLRDTSLALSRSIILNPYLKLLYGDWGEFLAFLGDKTLPDGIARNGAWAPHDIEIFKEYVSAGDVVLDVGANIGHHSVVFSKITGDKGLVVAIEAQRRMYQLVQANAILNNCGNIVPLHMAAGAEEGSVSLYPISYTDNTNYGALGVDTSDVAYEYPGEQVPVHQLDNILPEVLKGRAINFVKIDVQAYELFVLRGLSNILSSNRPTIFVEISPYWMHKAGYDYREIYELLKAHGYNLIHRDGTELSENGIPDVPLELDIEWDLLAVHPARESLR